MFLKTYIIKKLLIVSTLNKTIIFVHSIGSAVISFGLIKKMGRCRKNRGPLFSV